MSFPFSFWKTRELPRVGPFAGLARTVASSFGDLNEGSGVTSSRSNPFKRKTIRLISNSLSGDSANGYSIYIWCDKFIQGFDGYVTADGDVGGSATETQGGQGGSGFCGGGGGGSTDTGSIDIGSGGNGGTITDGEPGLSGEGSVGDTAPGQGGFGYGVDDGFTYSYNPDIGGAGGTANAPGPGTGGGGGGSGGRVILIANEAVFSALGVISAVGGRGGMAANNASDGDTGGPGAIYMAFRKKSGTISTQGTPIEIYQISGPVGAETLTAKTISDDW